MTIERDIKAAEDLGVKLGKGLADARAALAALDAQEDGREAADIQQKLFTTATAKESADLLARLADIQVRKNALVAVGVRQSLKERLDREWNAVRVGIADDYLASKVAQFDAVNEAVKGVPLALAQDIRASLEAPAEQATGAVRLHTAIRELHESIVTASRFGWVKMPQELQSRARWFESIRELVEWTDFTGNFRDAYELIQPLRRNLKSVSGMLVEDDPYPLFSAAGAVLVRDAGLKFVNRPVAERSAIVRRIAEDSRTWELAPTAEGPKLLTRADAKEMRVKAEAEQKRIEYLKNMAGAMGVDASNVSPR